jgi:hypothetical protein
MVPLLSTGSVMSGIGELDSVVVYFALGQSFWIDQFAVVPLPWQAPDTNEFWLEYFLHAFFGGVCLKLFPRKLQG